MPSSGKLIDMDLNYVNSIKVGGGKPVILVHGMAASLCDWSWLAPELAAHGCTAYALDLFGHGGSAKPDDPSYYTIEHIYSHFEGWVDSLELETAPVFVGHSLGGYLSLLYAMRRPQQVRGMILINPYYETRQLSPFVRMMSRRPALGEKAMRATPQWMVHTVLGWNPEAAANFSVEVRQQIAADYKRASPHFIYITREIPDLTPSLSQVDKPTRVVWGERDLTLKPASFPRLVQSLADADGIPVADTGHQPHISKPAQVNSSVLEFIQQDRLQ